MITSLRTYVALCFLIAFTGFSPEKKYRIFLIGDSTMADKPIVDNPEHGWGQMFPLFVTKNVAVINHAKNGRSTRSFLHEGRWDAVKNNLRSGDYVVIQFGHNDSKKEDTSRFADAKTDYMNNLMRFVHEAREKNAVPILLTPVNRRHFDKQGKFVDKHGAYPDVVRMVAVREKVPLIDLHQRSKALFEKLGEENSKKLFLVSVQPGIYHSLPNGKNDNTHFTRHGAMVIAQMVAEALRTLPLAVAGEVVDRDLTKLPGRGKIIGLDHYYNNEWKKVNDTLLIRHHYTWDDTTNGGFSELGRIFDRLGADTDTLLTAPTDESLKRFSVYIVVDPDTPTESPSPRFLDAEACDAIERWVQQGGVLVLLGNDKGNAEFEHFNLLAERFGIHFNEDMHQDVKNNQYDSGKVTQFGEHPLFNGVQYAFIKQFSSLTVRAPARPILVTRGVVAIAEASVGKGKVIAVGDPWFYNEYIDNRRLPAGYENDGAAESFARWVCSLARVVR